MRLNSRNRRGLIGNCAAASDRNTLNLNRTEETKLQMKSQTLLNVLVLLSLAVAASAQDQNTMYLAVDGRNPLAHGTYTGLENPNLGNLTLIYAHWNQENPAINHFHPIGSTSYEGPIESPTVISTNTNNRIPEYFTEQAPLSLQPGTGALAGKLISGENGEHYSNIEFFSIQDLAPAAAESPEGIMYNSSGGAYTGSSLDGMNVAIELISMTPGLYLGLEQLSEPGDQLVIGGPSDLPFEPIFWTDEDAAPGSYTAEFKLVDLSGTYASAGAVNFDFAVVPEPTGFGLALFAGFLGTVLRKRRLS